MARFEISAGEGLMVLSLQEATCLTDAEKLFCLSKRSIVFLLTIVEFQLAAHVLCLCRRITQPHDACRNLESSASKNYDLRVTRDKVARTIPLRFN